MLRAVLIAAAIRSPLAVSRSRRTRPSCSSGCVAPSRAADEGDEQQPGVVAVNALGQPLQSHRGHLLPAGRSVRRRPVPHPRLARPNPLRAARPPGRPQRHSPGRTRRPRGLDRPGRGPARPRRLSRSVLRQRVCAPTSPRRRRRPAPRRPPPRAPRPARGDPWPLPRRHPATGLPGHDRGRPAPDHASGHEPAEPVSGPRCHGRVRLSSTTSATRPRQGVEVERQSNLPLERAAHMSRSNST